MREEKNVGSWLQCANTFYVTILKYKFPNPQYPHQTVINILDKNQKTLQGKKAIPLTVIIITA